MGNLGRWSAADQTLATNPFGTTTTVYDAVSREVRTTTTDYDLAGRVAMTTDAPGHHTTYRYDLAGRVDLVTYHDGSTTRTKYDAQGRKSAEIDQNDLETDYGYDTLGRLTSVTLPLVPDPATSVNVRPVYSYTYDANGSRQPVTRPSTA